MQERRQCSRVPCHVPVRLFQEGPLQVIETLVKDLGLGGLRCVSPVLKPISTPLRVELTIGAGEKPFDLPGQIVWFKAIPKSEQFDLGIVFKRLSDSDRQRLSSYIQRISLQKVPQTI